MGQLRVERRQLSAGDVHADGSDQGLARRSTVGEPVTVQRTAVGRVAAGLPEHSDRVGPSAQSVHDDVRSPDRDGLPAELKGGIESLSGVSMDGVRVHYNSPEPRRLGARAYTRGSEIHVGPGEEQHLPHEAWHVVQQATGRVRPNAQLKSRVPVNADDTLEREADVMGARALRTPAPRPDRPLRRRPAFGAAAVQRYVLVNNAAGAVTVNALPGGVVPAEFEAQQPPQPGQAGQVLVAGAPAQLRVSEDGRMAIEDSDLSGRQPKVFYAEPGVWQASNAALTQSQYELYADRANAVTVTIPGAGTHNLDRVLARVRTPAAGVGGVRTADEEGLGLQVDQDCIMVATAIIGAPAVAATGREVSIAGGGGTSRSYGEYHTAAAMLKWAKSGKKTSKMWPNAWWELMTTGADSRSTRLALVEFGKALGGPTGMQALAQQYALLKQNKPAKALAVAAALGVNVHAEPAVGEAYESYQLGLPTNFATGPGPDFEADPTGGTMASLTTQTPGGATVRHGWGQHIGAVVAMSGGDRVTLENYARSHELGNMRAGPDYYFQMYGPPTRPAQTWHHAWTAGAVAAGIAPVKNAVTIVVRQ